MDSSDSDPLTEADCLAKYPEFARHATKAERAILLAVARFRKSLLSEFKGGAGPSQYTPNMFSHCASTLRQTGAWGKISVEEKERLERELLALPVRHGRSF